MHGKMPATGSAIENAITSVLAEHSNEKLLSFGAALNLMGLLLLHPSPRRMIHMIARQRPVEDLISLFLLLGPASQIVLENAPNINRDDLITRGADLLPMLRAESPEFDAFARSMSDSRESIEWTRKLTDSYLQASQEEGFDIEEYVSGHPELLSLTVDQYWLARLVTSKATGDELENLVAAIWGVRVALFDWRHRRK